MQAYSRLTEANAGLQELEDGRRRGPENIVSGTNGVARPQFGLKLSENVPPMFRMPAPCPLRPKFPRGGKQRKHVFS